MPPEQFGSYDVYERLGTGGMATVHRAERRGTHTGTPVALKRLLPQLSLIPEFVQAFLDEAKLARQLRHTNVAQTYDYGKVDDTYYIAMELVRGPTLSQLIHHCRGTVPIPVVLYVIVQLCDALEYAHNLCDEHGRPFGIIHRDVTPSNVIVSTEGIGKLIDFGIAKATGSEVRTKTGFIKGKFAYVAPEYTRGQIDTRVDLWAAGVIAHELLAGSRLFQVDNDMETLKRVQTMRIRPPSAFNPKVPPALDDIVMTSLARDPEQRWQRASAMRNAFAQVASKLPTSQQVAQWVAEAIGPMGASEASAVSIEIGLIEDEITREARPAIGKHVVAASRERDRAKILISLAVIAVCVIVLAIFLAVRH